MISRDAAATAATPPTSTSATGLDGSTGFPGEHAGRQREYADGHAT